jgi:RIO kinase 1
VYDLIAEAVRTLYQKAQLIHGDLSEYNIMLVDSSPVLFDFAQAVPPEHPMARSFLERDLVTLNTYFSKIGVSVPSIERLTSWVTGENGDKS